MDREALQAQLADPEWRIDNLYRVIDKYGQVVQFERNAPQRRLAADLHYLNLILKARQLGFSTLILLLALDRCLFNTNFSAGLVADTEANAQDLLNRIEFAYEGLPEALRRAVPVKNRNLSLMEFENGSSVRVGVSLRSKTLNFVHVSEYGKICARNPEKAREILTGTLNTFARKQLGFIESTAEGRSGDFYNKCQNGLRRQAEGRKPGLMDWKVHFFPWMEDEAYTLSRDEFGRKFRPDEVAYFEKLLAEGIRLERPQMRWYASKWTEQGDDMMREYPTTPEEAFASTKDGAYFGKQVRALRARKEVGDFPFEPRTPVNTFWDLGIDDSTAIWLHQEIAGRHCFIEYFESSGEGLSFYLAWLERWRAQRGAVFGRHFGPHDLDHRRMGENVYTLRRAAADAGYLFTVVPKTSNKLSSIERARGLLPKCRFAMPGCEKGLEHLESYSRDWNERDGVWRTHPRHDEHSHCADAFMTFADGYRQKPEEDLNAPKVKRRAFV